MVEEDSVLFTPSTSVAAAGIRDQRTIFGHHPFLIHQKRNHQKRYVYGSAFQFCNVSSVRLYGKPAQLRAEEATADYVSCDSLLTRFSRKMLLERLALIDTGSLLFTEGRDTHHFGDRHAADHVEMHIHSPRFYERTIVGGAMGAAESYLDGEWSTPDLTQLLRVLFRNSAMLARVQSWTSGLSRIAGRIQHLLRRNSRDGSRRNIHEHYDLGNEFFKLFLDPTMMYSSALFSRPGMTLEEASTEKLDRICRTLQLSPSDHVVEIGTGWAVSPCMPPLNTAVA